VCRRALGSAVATTVSSPQRSCGSHLEMTDPVAWAPCLAGPKKDSAGRAELLRFDVSGFNHRPPRFDLSSLQVTERLGCLQLTRENLLADVGEA
jgi:hypothetical protein